MQMITKAIAALGLAGAMAAGASSPAFAQAFYFSGPGVEVGVGVPAENGEYYGYYRGPGGTYSGWYAEDRRWRDQRDREYYYDRDRDDRWRDRRWQ
jgi:hypothetical protein